MAGFKLVHNRTAPPPRPSDATLIGVVIVDANPLMRAGLRGAIEGNADMVVVAEAANGHAAVTACRSLETATVVLDHGADSLGALETLTALKQQHPAVSVVISYVSCAPHEIVQLAQAGAGGFVAKNADPAEFAHAIRAVVNGGSYFSASIAGRLFRDLPSAAGVNLFGLSARELDVLRLIVSGYSNKDIARFLSISVRTVEAHRLNIRKKTSANRLKDLMQVATRLGLCVADRLPTAGSDQTPHTLVLAE